THPKAELFFLLGIDAFLEIQTWKHYEKILDQCSFIVLSRPPFRLDAARDVLGPGFSEVFREVGEAGLDLEIGKGEGVIYLLPIPEIDISSSAVRQRLSEGRSINDLVPPDVECYIRDHGLYRNKKRSEDSLVPLSKDSLNQEVKAAILAAQEKMAEDMILLDLKELSSFTDYFLIMHGHSTKQNTALCDHIERVLRKMKVKPLSIEGRSSGEWILMDYGYLIIHIFSDETRAYYSLEKLWGDAPHLPF
ncbi:MAG: ribosome silencing factor, partial [Candidatus Aminicenantes bacterium]|nr:ribosome silencing factor [Candidatus Aminicenantes bacterium]